MKLRTLVAGGLVSLVVTLSASAQEPGTPEFFLRDLQNMEESTRRQQDMMTNPAFGHVYWTEAIPIHVENYGDQLQHPDRPVVSLSRILPGEAADPYRQSWGGDRGIQQSIEYLNSCGARISGSVFAPKLGNDGPLDPVTGSKMEPPFPGIVISTGAIDGYEELYWWASQGLAEAGYVVMTYDVMGQGDSEGQCHDGSAGTTGFDGGMIDAIHWFRSDANPFRALIDESRLGIAGHSAGGSAVSRLGHRATLPVGENRQEVPNPVDAVVGWDGISNVYSGDDALTPRVPTMSQNADYFFNPTPRSSGPATSLPGWTGAFEEAEVPWMQVSLRASTHVEWTFVPYILPATRQGERVAMHYTLAWFDRYVKASGAGDAQAVDATARLTTAAFDGSADASSIGAGCYDLATNSNIPYTIEGECVAEHLSIYNLSGYDLQDGNASSDMLAEGCPDGSASFEETIPCGGPLVSQP